MDLVVLKDGPVTLSCSVDGATDVQESLREEDVEAVIEIKAAPSQDSVEASRRPAFRAHDRRGGVAGLLQSPCSTAA